jgi:hypothetical protein
MRVAKNDKLQRKEWKESTYQARGERDHYNYIQEKIKKIGSHKNHSLHLHQKKVETK